MSEKGRNLTKVCEGLRLAAYLDGGGVPTIGYGHIKGVKLGDTCDELQATVWLIEDLEEAEDAVNKLVTIQLTSGQFDALVDFVFNLGRERFRTSTLLKKVNAKDPTAKDEFLRWKYDNGKVVQGLLNRRIKEAALFVS